MANAITWPTVPLISDAPDDATGDNRGMIEISDVYVTHDDDNLYVSVEGPRIMRYKPGAELEGYKYSECYIHLNGLEVTVYDNDFTGDTNLVFYTSTCGNFTAPCGSANETCMVAIPLTQLGDATQICIWVETLHRHYLSGWNDSSDRAPNAGCETYYITNELTAVEIDIKPGSFPNSINPDSKGVIPVAILTTGDFDASTVDGETARFGPDEAPPVHYAIEDVDSDGDYDMILHFKTQDTGIKAGDTEATLTAETTGGTDIVGTDSVRTVPPKGKKGGK